MAIPAPIVISLSARPWQTSNLSFEVGGILGQIAQLGAAVTPFPFAAFFSGFFNSSGLGATGSDPSLLRYDSNGILTASQVVASTLAALRAEPRKAALDRAGLRPPERLLCKIQCHRAENIYAAATNSYGSGPTANPALLQTLASLAQQQFGTLLIPYYQTNGPTGVVNYTYSRLNSTTYTTDSSTTTPDLTTTTTPTLTTTMTYDLGTSTTGQSNQLQVGRTNMTMAFLETSGGGPGVFTPPPPKGESVTAGFTGPGSNMSAQEGTSGATSTETGTTTAVEGGSSSAEEVGSEKASGSALATQNESIQNYDYVYRVPYFECQAQYARAQISLNDQQFALTMATQNLADLPTVFQNELISIDLNVYQLQIAFLNTILLSPIGGIVTGIYKNPGDAVRAGEPVVRVEDNSQMYLVARLKYRGPIVANSTTVTVSTTLFDAAGSPPPTPLSGKVVAVRGRGDDDQWDVVILCPNYFNLFPIGYQFDYDNTSVSIT